MLTIILGIGLAVLIAIISFAIPWDKIGFLVFGLALIVGFLAIITGLGAFHISGFTEWQLIQETELISLSNDLASGGTGCVYVSLSADNAYTYRYEINSEFGTETSKEYKTATLVGADVEEIEDTNCNTPIVMVYKREGKMSFWTFGWLNTQIKYVFYVPEGTISKEVKLD